MKNFSTMRSWFVTTALLLALTGFLVAPAAKAQNAANADAAYNGFISAYLQTSNVSPYNFPVPYITQSISNRDMAFFWQQAYMITGVEDAYERNYATSRKQQISNLLDGFITQNLTNWSWDAWNDDVAWACIAMVRGYVETGNTTYLNEAVTNWNMAYNRGWDSTYGGGIWERMDEVPNGGKCGLSNWPFVIAGCFIYQANHDATILSKSQAIYAWGRSHIFNTSNGSVWEGWYPSGAGGDDNAYNDGLIINAANALYKITGTTQYFNDAQLAVNHIMSKYPSILDTDKPANGGFGGDQVYRGISLFARQNNLWNTYWPWLQNNCAAAWNNRRTDYNISCDVYTDPTPQTGDLLSMSALTSVVVQAVTQMNPLTGVHAITNQSTGLAIDNGSTSTQGAKVVQWGLNGGNSQKWIFTQNSDNSWNIVSVYSGQALDDPGASKTNGTQMDQWGVNGGSNQKWWVDVQSDGSYKIWNVASGLALDNDNLSANGTPLIQWTWTGSNNQRWILR
ncbi:hypothetical protein CCAX7_19910 [Capsulimonas corticalis]|uniref:Uncharacterized protein n=1 Tax=Capsulimonas corticalis TaxID=2219043 RepID=A0A402D2P4_9BACT|nr:RICIN domain-containing protein [Capsulimonas corticalis]BDI29940.1 hypothetical protein CCAX7_19910 [Capsulimonas corticalis]